MIVSVYEAGMYNTALGIQRLPRVIAMLQVGVGADLYDARTRDATAP